MRRTILRSWKTAAVLAAVAAGVAAWSATSMAASAKPVRVAIMTDCKGAFAFGYEFDIGGAQAAFAQFAGGKTKSHAKPSAGMTGIKAGKTPIQIVGYGCGNDTVPVAVTETKRLMEQLNADVMVGPLSGDEGIAVANYAKEHADKTFINGIAGAQDSTLKVQAPNFFRYHPDGAQWSAGLGDYAYNDLKWKNAAIIGDDYSFPYTSLAGFVAALTARPASVDAGEAGPSAVIDLGGMADGTAWVVVPATPALDDYAALVEELGRTGPVLGVAVPWCLHAGGARRILALWTLGHVAAMLAIFLVTPNSVTWHVTTALPRLWSHVSWPAAACVVACVAGAWRQLAAEAPAAPTPAGSRAEPGSGTRTPGSLPASG